MCCVICCSPSCDVSGRLSQLCATDCYSIAFKPTVWRVFKSEHYVIKCNILCAVSLLISRKRVELSSRNRVCRKSETKKEDHKVKKCKWYWNLAAVSLVVLIGSTGGCLSPSLPEQEAPTSDHPVINAFTVSPATISSGQMATLSWNVSNATTVTIQPTIGGVDPSGTEQVSPTTTATYTLAATNKAGTTKESVAVTVTSAVSGKPDLVITDFWLAGNTVNYKMKNQGDADAESSRSYLYVNDLQTASDYVVPLAAGQEITTKFSNYSWDFSLNPAPNQTALGISTHSTPGPGRGYHVELYTDSDDAVDESNEANNCSEQVWGLKFTYDFVEKASKATWKSSSGKLEWVTAPSSKKGAAFVGRVWLEDGGVYLDTLSTYPEQVSHGWIQGKYGEFYSESQVTQSRTIRLPEMAKFTAKIGFKRGATATDGVAVALGYIGVDESLVFFDKMDVYYDGALDVYEIDLSDIAGEEVYFILRVETKDSWEQDWPVWVEAKIVQGL